jgi:hypothetical protein
MQNAVIMLGAIVGILIGGWLGVYFFDDPGNADPAVIILLGAMLGSVAGGWIGYKLTDR